MATSRKLKATSNYGTSGAGVNVSFKHDITIQNEAVGAVYNTAVDDLTALVHAKAAVIFTDFELDQDVARRTSRLSSLKAALNNV